MKNVYYYCFFFFLISVLTSCEIYNPKEPIPAYIRIKKFDLTSTSTQGTNSHKITDAWVYVDEELIGCFELPTRLPVLKNGIHRVKIRAGIKVNGISATRTPYPFYTNYELDVNLVEGQVIELNPIVSYISNTQFSFIEDFEGTGHIFYPRPLGTDTVIKITTIPSEVFEGSGSGIVGLNYSNNIRFFEAITDPNTQYVLPASGSPVFLEINYKCDYPFSIGLYGYTYSGTTLTNTQQVTAIQVNNSSSWNKMYVYLSPIITSSIGASKYSVFIGTLNNTGQSIATIQIDDIKLVHF